MAVGRAVKKAVLAALASENWEEQVSDLMEIHSMQTLIAPLFSSLCAPVVIVRWHGVSAFGRVLEKMVDEDAPKARIVMRRIMWMLNEESGGCGWGVPEAMGEIVSSSDLMAEEYGKILLSYIHEEEKKPENFLEFTPLLRGAIWGVARIAQSRPDIAAPAANDLIKLLKSSDQTSAGFACWALAGLKEKKAVNLLKSLTDNDFIVEIYKDCSLQSVTVGKLAQEALENIFRD